MKTRCSWLNFSRAILWACSLWGGVLRAEPWCVVVDGHPGGAAFSEDLEAAGRIWMQSAGRARCRAVRVSPGQRGAAGSPAGEGVAPLMSQKDRLRVALEGLESPSEDPLWLVLNGHGNAQGKEPRFNLEGGDLGLGELRDWLGKIRRPMVVVLGFSSSGAFVKGIAAPGRIVVSATRSGEEENWSRFGKAFATALTEEASDGNGDGQVSIFEAWWAAQDRVEAFYKESGRIQTEHAVLEDLGEGLPAGKEAFDATGNWKGRGSGKEREVGALARQSFWIASPLEAALTAGERERRRVLEGRLAEWKARKAGMDGGEYERGLEQILLELAEVYAGAKARLEPGSDGTRGDRALEHGPGK
jgi:hypothetical protein